MALEDKSFIRRANVSRNFILASFFAGNSNRDAVISLSDNRKAKKITKLPVTYS